MAVPPPLRQDSTFSIASKQSASRTTALEVHELVYGHGVRSQLPPADVEAALQRIYEPNASTYENPILTATSRGLIREIYQAAHHFSELDMPWPLAMFSTLFWGRSVDTLREPWFRALRVWSEIGDICETESFDGHRKSIVEHTVHMLFLPGLHEGRAGRQRSTSDASMDIIAPLPPPPLLYSLPHLQRTSQPSLVIPGTRMTVPSPLHFQMHILSRIEFNDLGRVTHHRDFWDVKDLVALVPGAGLAQFVGTRMAARALAAAGNIGAWLFGQARVESEREDMERNGDTCTAGSNSLGLLGIDLPDVDKDTN